MSNKINVDKSNLEASVYTVKLERLKHSLTYSASQVMSNKGEPSITGGDLYHCNPFWK